MISTTPPGVTDVSLTEAATSGAGPSGVATGVSTIATSLPLDAGCPGWIASAVIVVVSLVEPAEACSSFCWLHPNAKPEAASATSMIPFELHFMALLPSGRIGPVHPAAGA
jgi:hypothetical protein